MFFPSIVFTFGLAMSPSKSLGVRQLELKEDMLGELNNEA
jgi:hypothetical protein